jgi:hypothetical protein
MPDLAKPVEFSFIIETIGVIFLIIAIGIYMVKMKKEQF